MKIDLEQLRQQIEQGIIDVDIEYHPYVPVYAIVVLTNKETKQRIKILKRGAYLV